MTAALVAGCTGNQTALRDDNLRLRPTSHAWHRGQDDRPDTVWQPMEPPTTAATKQDIPVAPEPVPEVPADWHISPETTRRPWRYIVLHHTASAGATIESVHLAHRSRGWQGIGYHFLIGNGNGELDGTVQPTFRWQQQMWGAHAGNQPYNDYGIGIALVGNFQQSSPTQEQIKSAKQLVTWLRREFNISRSAVLGHNDVRATACPGRYFPLELIAGSGETAALSHGK